MFGVGAKVLLLELEGCRGLEFGLGGLGVGGNVLRLRRGRFKR